MLNDIAAGQLTQTKPGAFEVGRNLATTPGKVIKRDAALPADPVHADDRRGAGDAAGDLPAVDQPLLHPRPHAREKLRQMVRRPGHHPVHGQLEVGRREHRRRDARRLCAQGPGRRDRHGPRPARRRERARDRLLRRRHDARRDARLSSRQEAGRPRSSRRPSSPPRSISREAGDLKLFLGDETMALLDAADRARRAISTAATWPRPSTCCAAATSSGAMSSTITCWARSRRRSTCSTGTATRPTCRPSWHRDYLETLYKGNKLVESGGISVAGTPIDIGTVKTPTYIQAGREDHIAPPQSVWKIMDHFPGRSASCSPARAISRAWSIRPPRRNINIGSTTSRRSTLEAFIDGATEHKGSWWPDWIEWLKQQDPKTVEGEGRAHPGQGQAQGDRGRARALRQGALSSRSGPGWPGRTSGSTLKSCSSAHRAPFPNIVSSSMAHPDAIAPAARADRARRRSWSPRASTAVAGFAVVVVSAGSAELDGLFVEPDLWRRGVGSALVETCGARGPARRSRA